MTTVQLFWDIANEYFIIVRALRSITAQQAEKITQAVQACDRAWEVQTIDDYDGYLSIFVEPIVQSDKQKSFFISGTAERLELFDAQGDNLVAIASFNDVEAISARLLILIAQQR